MRWLNLSYLLGAVSLAAVATAASSSSTDSDEEPTRENTYFNQKKVPPMLELTPDNWEKESKATKWLMVKHYSPWCPHCIDFAPKYQTLYEFYYTSTPQGSGNENADFTTFYDFKFASINCVAYYDLCSEHGIGSYPTTVLYKDGEAVETVKGVKNLNILSGMIEDALEKTKPGTRPAKITLPEPGAHSTPDGPATIDLSKPTKAEPAKEKVVAEPEGTAAASKADPSADAKAKVDEKTGFNIDYQAPVHKAPKAASTPNPNGSSISLSAETFQAKVTMTQEPWFIKFYAPWCHHCQAMAPNWEQLAKQMKGKLNIGEVNCDAESRLCKDAQLRGFPTILFFKGGERVEYDGLRGLGDFIQYAEKALDIASGVPEVDEASFKALEEKEEVIFVYFYDHATTSEDFIALERLPLSLIGHAKLVKTRDPKLYERYKITTWPRLLVSREGRPTYYTPLTPKEMRDTHQVLNWMKSVWLPIVPEMTASNAREIMDGKIVVLGILNRDDQDSFTVAKREMKSAATEWMDKQIQLFQLERQELRDAKQLRIEEAEDRGDQRALRAAKSIRINMDKTDRKQVTFAWVDGIFWQRWIKTTYGFDVKDGDRVIINDEDNRRYWDVTITGNYIVPSRTSILETVNKVTASPPKIKPKLTIGALEKIFFDIKMTFSEHPYLSMGCILGLGLGCASWFRGRLRRTARGHFRLEDSVKEFKAPLLGAANGGAKVD
ncbi:thioredoxin-like protein [Apodospora peruviana]|uniref:Thioredoxin-like protein n=1 Tax=Apodospora peruviana TaxID=516989 RepID=A0AAE0I6N0_9PEZI|nr:thioredoxin-like protein [Apodospora peruviana]